MENFYSQEGPLMKISNSYVAGFLKAQKLALKQPDNIMGINIPVEMDMGLELKAKIAEKREMLWPSFN